MVRLTALSPAAGCAAKLGMDELDGLLSGVFGTDALGSIVVPPEPVALPETPSSDSSETVAEEVIGIGDDGAVVTVGSRQVVVTTDFFTPIVDDPHTWGHVAATNAIGDVHAMGGRPTAALVVLGWPAGAHRAELAGVMAGLRDGAVADGTALVGGHTIDSSVPFVGLAVLGDLDHRPLRQDGVRPGDRLVLTAPLGTGIVTTAARAASPDAVTEGGRLRDAYRAAVDVMTTSNAPVVAPARDHDVVAATDVTGFGLLGHLHGMARRSAVDVMVAADRVGILPGVTALVRAGSVPAGSTRNAEAVVRRAAVDTDPLSLAVLSDAQTSGGLLLACPSDRVAGLVDALAGLGHPAREVGMVDGAGSGRIRVTGRVG